MFRSLHMKLTLILLLLITSLMAVVGAFLTTSVSSFYINSFYQQMDDVFGADRREFILSLRQAAAQDNGAEAVEEILRANAGSLGVDYRIVSGRLRRRLRTAPGAECQSAHRPQCRGPKG